MSTASAPATFEFLSPLDGKKYYLPAYDPEKWVDEVAAHPDFVPKVSIADALLTDDPNEGQAMLMEPINRLNTLMVRGMVKTLRNHLAEDDPAWLALKALIDAPDWAALGKVFREWRAASGDVEVDSAGEG